MRCSFDDLKFHTRQQLLQFTKISERRIGASDDSQHGILIAPISSGETTVSPIDRRSAAKATVSKP